MGQQISKQNLFSLTTIPAEFYFIESQRKLCEDHGIIFKPATINNNRINVTLPQDWTILYQKTDLNFVLYLDGNKKVKMFADCDDDLIKCLFFDKEHSELYTNKYINKENLESFIGIEQLDHYIDELNKESTREALLMTGHTGMTYIDNNGNETNTNLVTGETIYKPK